jgi:hypothetical protein
MADNKVPITDIIARYFDLIFSVGFMGEAIWFIFAKPTKMSSVTWILLIIYYVFFSGIMLLAFLNNKTLLKYCGFFRGY